MSSSSRHGETPPAYIEERKDGVVTRSYKRGKLLGKGGFARVYELTDLSNSTLYACKFIAKSSLTKQRAKDKLKSEIAIHDSLNHENIVKFHRCWEDTRWVYILLELCPNHTLMEMIRARKRLTEEETQFYLLQLIRACQYMQNDRVIHRDLKLGNLFLGRSMEIKVGDFGLATKLVHAGEKKRTICGTPNYIAPEILEGRRGHSYEVDAWSIGVIVYTMIIGKPPFETADVKSTYRRIKANSYSFPPTVRISDDAKNLIRGLLSSNPESRPSLTEMLMHPFMARATKLPSALPRSALRTIPHDFIDACIARGAVIPSSTTARASSSSSSGTSGVSSSGSGSGSSLRQPLGEIQPKFYAPAGVPHGSRPASAAAGSHGSKPSKGSENGSTRPASAYDAYGRHGRSEESAKDRHALRENNAANVNSNNGNGGNVKSSSSSSKGIENGIAGRPASASAAAVSVSRGRSAPPSSSNSNNRNGGDLDADECGAYDDLHKKISQSIARKDGDDARALVSSVPVSLGAPASDLTPPTWVTKWVDYSNKYGLGYQLSDGTMGVYFNDSTKIVEAADGQHVEYYDRKRTPQGSYDEQMSFLLDNYPDTLQKKVTLLTHFKNYLIEHTAPSSHGDRVITEAEAPKSDMIYVKKWMMTRHAIIFRLSNTTVQTNFFDHTKLVLSSKDGVVTYINKNRELQTFPLNATPQVPDISKRLQYAKKILYELVQRQRPATTATAAVI